MRIERTIMQIYEKIYYNKKIHIDNVTHTMLNKENIIFTIAFNNYEVIEEQINTIKTHCLDEYSYLVVDNSSDLLISKRIEEICTNNPNVTYLKLPKWNYKKLAPSNSHGIALNYVFKSIFKGCTNIKNVLLLDHDIFPLKNFSITEINNSQDVYGLKNAK